MDARSTDITSFTEHRQHLRDHFDQVHETGRPLYVTKNGHTEAVVLSATAYDTLAAKAELMDNLAALDRGMEDVRAGRGQDMKEALREIAAELGLKLDR